ncbi:unnamed protein product [Ectocarpus sp. CCAP 1310/34]|nr:unnamed protein product [Ectocarpus sp. CCAP 1310/34]
MLLRKATEKFGEESSKLVFAQANGRAPLTFAEPVVEWKDNVPPELGAFLDALAYPVEEDANDDDLVRARVARKCLLAGVLTSFAHETWYKNANISGLFLKDQWIQRDGLDFLASNFKISQTDNHLWKLRTRLADILGTESEMKKLVPLTAALMAASFDNLNVDVLRHWGAGGHVDLIAAIAYFHVLKTREKVTELQCVPPTLDFARDFGPDNERLMEIWGQFRRRVVACVRRDSVKSDGDFEVQVARQVIDDAHEERMVGVEDRRVPSDVKATYLGVVKLGTKTLPDIIEYLDGLKQVLHAGAEHGRRRAVIVGDQETFNLVHKAKQKYEVKYTWAIPWVGDWHLLEHTLDVMFLKWGGFGIMPLAKRSDCYNNKLEKKDYHNRHNVFIGIMEAAWRACVAEVGGSSAPAMTDDDVLNELLGYRTDRTKHKTCGQWVEMLLVDGMAYLALYIGDFDLREAALRKIAPLFLGYNKYKYHDSCIKHLADICRMSPTERSFMSKTFSLSLSGVPGKNTSLDEIQEMTMNKDFKGAATGTDIRYLQKLGLTLQLFACSVQDFKEVFGSKLVYNRKIYASAHRTMSVRKMVEVLTAEESPFRLQSACGREA